MVRWFVFCFLPGGCWSRGEYLKHKKDDYNLFQPLFTLFFINETEFTAGVWFGCKGLSICFGTKFILFSKKWTDGFKSCISSVVLLWSNRLIIKTSCNVNIQTFPKHLLKTITLISAFSCFFLLFLCNVDVPLALNCFKGARLCLYQSDGCDTQQHLQLKVDIDDCYMLIIVLLNQLICEF